MSVRERPLLPMDGNFAGKERCALRQAPMLACALCCIIYYRIDTLAEHLNCTDEIDIPGSNNLYV